MAAWGRRMRVVNRVIMTLVLLLVIAIVIIFRPIALPIFVAVAGVISFCEVHAAMRAGGMKPCMWTGITMILGMIPMYYLMGQEGILVLYMVLTTINLVWAVFLPQRMFSDIIISVFLMFYPVWGFVALLMINDFEPQALAYVGIGIALLSPSVSDIFALIAGRCWGRHKLAPQISPKKTVEGSVGGLLGCVGITVLGGYLCRATGFYLGLELWQYAAIGVCTGVFAQVGDLTASVIKRYTGIKDFGTILMSHGGVMDRMDSIIMGSVAVICLLKLMVAV